MGKIKSSYKFLYLSVLIEKVNDKIIISNFISTEISREGLYQEKKDNLPLLEGQYIFNLLCLDILFHGVYLIDQDFEKENTPNPPGGHNYLSAFKCLGDNHENVIKNHFQNKKGLIKVLTKFHTDFNKIRYPHQHLMDMEDFKGDKTKDESGFVYELNIYNKELCWLIDYLRKEITNWLGHESILDE